MSWAQIDDMTENLRRKYDLLSTAYFPVVEVLEMIMSSQYRLFDIEIVSENKMRGEYATTTQDGRLLKIREDVYHKAYNGEGRARFTLAHEMGHLTLHCCGVEVFALSSGEHVPPYRHSEKQADYFAASLLMPKKFFSFEDNTSTVQHRHGVSAEAARIRLAYLRSKGFLKPPSRGSLI
jgi:hypothetical protein